MKTLSTSRKLTSDPTAKASFPTGSFLHWSLMLGFASIIGLRVTRSDSFAFGLSLGLLSLCVISWLVFMRRRLWSKCYPSGGRWMTAVSALLWSSLLIGPVVTGIFLVGAHFFSDAPDGMARLNLFARFVVFGLGSFSAAYCIGILAIFIQIWRDQWNVKLTLTAISCLFVLFVAYVWIVTNPTN